VPHIFGVGGEQPVDGEHVPGVMQASGDVHVTALPPPHTPAEQVSPILHMLPVLHGPPEVGMHMPVVAEQLLQPVHAEPSFCQAPFASHSCGCVPLHLRAVGLHAPVQAPPLQTFVQAEPLFVQVPVASHT